MVDAFNAMLPKRAPRLIYRRHDVLPCAQVTPRNGIVLCEPDAELVFQTIYRPHDHVIGKARIVLSNASAEDAFFQHTLCHEFMHALTDANHGHYRRPTTSCVQGDLTAPGPWDRKFAKKVYGHHSGPRHAARGKHR